MRRFFRPAIVGLAVLPFTLTQASACNIDGKPSVFANGARAVTFKEAPTAATFKTWAHFAFALSYRENQWVRFAEDDRIVRPLLRLANLRRSYKWTFGDGSASVGDRAGHRYRHPGTYKVGVYAYYPNYGGWQQFDSVTIRVR